MKKLPEGYWYEYDGKTPVAVVGETFRMRIGDSEAAGLRDFHAHWASTKRDKEQFAAKSAEYHELLRDLYSAVACQLGTLSDSDTNQTVTASDLGITDTEYDGLIEASQAPEAGDTGHVRTSTGHRVYAQ